ncbi:MAG: TIR domain-containing protein [Alistipes sp.]|nr:TIR domain-containing protein [Alistipes sp.]
MAYDLFISYSRRDYTDESNQVIPGNIITQIKQLLDANGITYWFDEDGIFSGDAFAPEIARNIKSSKIFLFISSEHSNASEWTSNEIATAHTYKKKIIPFKYDDSIYNDSVIMYISRLDYIDYPANPIKALDRLLSSIKDYLNKLAEKEHNERLAEERRRNEEISRKEKAAKLQALKEKITTLETRKLDIEKDILSQEKSLSELRNEKRIIELNIAEIEEEIEALSPRKKADSVSIITNILTF